jgi:hypothetical protein
VYNQIWRAHVALQLCLLRFLPNHNRLGDLSDQISSVNQFHQGVNRPNAILNWPSWPTQCRVSPPCGGRTPALPPPTRPSWREERARCAAASIHLIPPRLARPRARQHAASPLSCHCELCRRIASPFTHQFQIKCANHFVLLHATSSILLPSRFESRYRRIVVSATGGLAEESPSFELFMAGASPCCSISYLSCLSPSVGHRSSRLWSFRCYVPSHPRRNMATHRRSMVAARTHTREELTTTPLELQFTLVAQLHHHEGVDILA